MKQLQLRGRSSVAPAVVCPVVPLSNLEAPGYCGLWVLIKDPEFAAAQRSGLAVRASCLNVPPHLIQFPSFRAFYHISRLWQEASGPSSSAALRNVNPAISFMSGLVLRKNLKLAACVSRFKKGRIDRVVGGGAELGFSLVLHQSSILSQSEPRTQNSTILG